jgi:uncharacterized protein (TIGR02679 family)
MRTEVAEYLRSNPAWHRILEVAEAKYHSYSGLRGLVLLEGDAELRAISGIRCRIIGKSRVRLADLDEALRVRTRFRCTLHEALEAYFGRQILTRDEQAKRDEAAWAAVIEAMRDTVRIESGRAAVRLLDWLEGDEARLRADWRTESDDMLRVVRVVARAMARLPETGPAVPLPVLADAATGNAHALDRTEAAGRYFERALYRTHPSAGVDWPLDAAGRDALFAAAGLTVDDVSSTVLASGLVGAHPVITAARDTGSVLSLPLCTVDEIGNVAAWNGVAFVVENPSVFSAIRRDLADLPPASWPTLICTSGQLSLAARRLLDRIVSSGGHILYSGDFDAPGLMIARGLRRRLPEAMSLWCMDVESYRAALSRRDALEDRDPGTLSGLEKDFPELSAAMAASGAAYQESLIPMLTMDVRAHAVTSGS